MNGDIQQDYVRHLSDSITTRHDMFLFCGLLPFNCRKQCLDAAGLVLPQAENFGCDTHVAPWQHVPQDVLFLRGKRPIGLSYSGHSYQAVAASTEFGNYRVGILIASWWQEVAQLGHLEASKNLRLLIQDASRDKPHSLAFALAFIFHPHGASQELRCSQTKSSSLS